ncbi:MULTISPECIES: GNAT family N-acetyltransferase [unclassified Solwaraspora]|uniref:GNAT family N-acetyltransferase n=1 Tax=unclassified Solwaraspora TaxID=2627926 RepID=UPI00259B64CA|nr:GNAT family N-acetyltransferase [Solwaraspora sp. WMMA2056]WJK44075.1 GNAT family N-acetyltransferase [Solwaraspora sp. WMMA2056]
MLVQDDPARHRFEILIDDALAGFAAYRLTPGTVTVTHTEIDPAHRGKGAGDALAHGMLSQIRERDEQVVPQCPFIAAYIDRHPEFASLVAGD